ncbi:MAG: DEAD/DEAH box helicase [bacterium]
MSELRPHQIKARQQILDALAAGYKRPVVAAPCSFGKTILAASMMMELAEKHGKRSVFYCDRLKLVDQTCATFARMGADFSVMQGQDWRFNPNKLIQIASVQTAARRKRLQFDFAFIDECHVLYKSMKDLMLDWNNVPMVGLSATPISKSLGAEGLFDHLIVPTTPRELISQGYLCPTDYYVGRSADISGVKTKALATGGSDYDPIELAAAIEKDKCLSGDIIKNYIAHGQGKQAICFTPSIAQSKELVAKFNAAGIKAIHIDGYMDQEERDVIYRGHREKMYQILCCSKLLGVGFDDPSIEVLIMAHPTKSRIFYIQTAGRIWRTHPGKEKAIYLDHSGNLERFGVFPEDIIPSSLDDGTKQFNEKSQTKEPEEKEKKIKQCPQCTGAFTGMRCECGYEIPIQKRLYTDDQILEKIERSLTIQQQWYSELILFARQKGYKDGYAAHKFKAKFKTWPPKQLVAYPAESVSTEVSNYIKYLNIRSHYARKNS